MAANTGVLAGKVLFITGASRGIGRAIALKAAKDGAKIIVAAKTKDPHPKLPGTIYTVAEEIAKAGGECLPCIVDVRSEEQVSNAVQEAVKAFGGIDILINNASAISLTNTTQTQMKTYDLMMDINTRGTYLCSKLCLPQLRRSKHAHILNLSPPLNMSAHWFKDHVAYTMAKYGMSMCVLGMSHELAEENIAVNALWPRTAIYTAAMKMLGGGTDEIASQCRTPEIIADAAYIILSHSLPKDGKAWTGQFFIDDEVLQKAGVTDLEKYSCVPGSQLLPDFFLDVSPSDKKFQNLKADAKPSAPAATSSSGDVKKTFKNIEAALSPDVVKTVNSTFLFVLNGPEEGKWFLDLKTGSGKCGPATSTSETFECTMTMSSEDFVKMFTGKLNPTQAFMAGQLKIAGNLMAAMKLEKLMKQMRAKL